MMLEVRSLVEPIEFRSKDGKLTAAGVAMRYGARSKPINGQFREVFHPGAFGPMDKILQEQDIYCHNEHHGPYLGRTGAGSLRLFDSRSELAYELDLPDTTAGRDTAALLERGDIKGSSIGFRAIPKEVKWSVDEHGMALRSITGAHLRRVDLTIAPYYPDSTAEMAFRSLADETGLELRSLLEAADRGDLATIINAPHQGQNNDDGRETTVHRRPAHWFA